MSETTIVKNEKFRERNQRDTLARMDYWDWVREQVEEVLAERGEKLSELSRASGVKYSRLYAFMSGQNATIRQDAVKALSQVTGRNLSETRATMNSSGQIHDDSPRSSGNPLDDEIPVVDIHHFPAVIPEGQLRETLSNVRHGWHRRSAQDPKDPDLFYLTVNERIGRRIEPGDDVLVSPATRPRHGSFVAVRVKAEDLVRTGRFLVVGKARSVELGSGEVLAETDFEVIGTILRGSIDLDLP